MEDAREGVSYDDVMLVPKRSSVTDLDAVDTTTSLADGLTLELPVLSAAMDTVTEAAMADAVAEAGGMGVVHRFATVAEQARMVSQVVDAGRQVGAAVGIAEEYTDRADALLEAGADCLVVDIAHGHLDACLDAVRTLDGRYDLPLMVGNVATAAAVEDLAAAGADCVKVGIGPGSHCTTRRMTGAGVPQLTAVQDCAAAAAEHGVTTVADGGIRHPGEAVKALAAGADAVMVGGMLMGTDEAPGELVERDDGRYKKTRGMASHEARTARTDKDADGHAEEGVTALTPYRGSVDGVLAELRGGLQSGISYCGADTLADARANAEFIRVSAGAKGREAAHGHGIQER